MNSIRFILEDKGSYVGVVNAILFDGHDNVLDESADHYVLGYFIRHNDDFSRVPFMVCSKGSNLKLCETPHYGIASKVRGMSEADGYGESYICKEKKTKAVRLSDII